jgi:hypothetical protein
MMTAKETAIHLETLRQSHEITRDLTVALIKLKAQFKPDLIILTRNRKTWLANGVPLPFAREAKARDVAAHVAKRFPHSDITVRL